MRIATRISSLLLVIASAFTISCETKELIFKGPYFIRFTEDTETLKESYSSTVKIEVHHAGPAPKGDVTIDYVVGGSARQGIDYTIASTPGKVKIKSGEYFGYIEVLLINNSNNILNTQDVTFTLLGVENRIDLQVGQGQTQIGRTFTLSIQDDCILGGNYYGIRTASDIPIENITITSLDCTNYTLSNWDVYVMDFIDTRSLVFIDNGDNTLTIEPQQDATIDGTVDGSGVVDPTTRIITFTVHAVDGDDVATTGTFQLIPD
jgi:hypothetical protein